MLRITLNLIGLAFESCVDERAVAARVEQDRQTGSQIGVDGTPSLFLNGRAIGRMPTEEQLRQLLR